MPSPSSITFVHESLRHLGRELRSLHWRGARAVLAAQTVGSVLLAVLLADLLQVGDRWWVAISAYVVMRADWQTSWRRAVQRMIGTLAGAGACLLLAPWVRGETLLYIPTLALMVGVGVYMTLGSTRSYAWLLATITAALVFAEADPGRALWALAGWRVLDVTIGTGACVAVAGAVHLLRPHLDLPLLASAPGAPAPDPRTAAARRERFWQSLPSALCVGLVAALHELGSLPAYQEVLVTVIVLPVIPLATLMQRDQSEAAVARRMGNRILGCLLAALFAFALLPWVGGQPLLYMVSLAVGIWLASHVHSGHEDSSYIGLQFGIAFVMVFVQDRDWTGDLRPAVLRLTGILGGVLLLAMLRLGLAALRTRARRTT